MPSAAVAVPAAASVVGGILARRSGGNATQTASNEPWRFLSPYLTGGNRQGVSQQGRPPVQGLYDLSYEQAMRPLSGAYTFGPQSVAARNALMTQTRNPSALEQASRGEFQRTIEGDYLYGGPGFEAAYQAGANRIMPQVSSMFSGGGRLNSGLAQTAMTQGLGDVFAGLYNNERARQVSAASQYPAMQQAQLQRLNVPLALGETADELRRQRAFEPQQRLQWYGQQLGQVNPGGGTTTTSTPMASNTLGGLLGGAMLGQSIYSGLQGSTSPLWGGGSGGFMSGLGYGAGTGYQQAFPFDFSGGY